MRIFILVAMAVGCFGQQECQVANGNIYCISAPDHGLMYSAVFLASSNVADAISSRGLYEQNPILGRGQFGTRQDSIKAGAIAAVLLTEWSLRKHPALRSGFTWMNYIVGGVTFGAAVHNFKER